MYHHKQIGWIIIFSFTVAAICVLYFIPPPGLIIALIVLLILGATFGSLSISISDDRNLIWYFGPGFWKHKISIDNIAEVKDIKYKWYYGWGIRITPQGWLYSVSGLSAIQIILQTGKRVCLGTDEPEKLKAAIMNVISKKGNFSTQD